MLDSDVENVFRKLFDDVQKKDQFDQLRPLLAHYTAIQSVERIIENSELWFGSPLFMNDHEEVRFGLLEGERLLKSSPEIVKACGSPERAARFFSEFDGFSRHYVGNHLGDTYVFCLSRHGPQDNDGRLSMWRGYGGNGNGAAIVFDTAQLNAIPTSALIVAKVEYGTHDERRAAIGTFITTFCEMLRVNEVTDDQLRIAAYWIYERIKLFALFSKHIGFAEEEEWRVVYMRERDREKKLDEMFGYLVGPRDLPLSFSSTWS